MKKKQAYHINIEPYTDNLVKVSYEDSKGSMEQFVYKVHLIEALKTLFIKLEIIKEEETC